VAAGHRNRFTICSRGTPSPCFPPSATRFCAAASSSGVFILYPLLATLTPVLDGTVGGVSVAYLVGFLVIMFGLAVALTHTARATASEGD